MASSYLCFLKDHSGDFPGGPGNQPSNAEDAGSIPGRGTKIPRAVGQLSPARPIYRAHVLWSLHTTTREASVPQLRPAQPN